MPTRLKPIELSLTGHPQFRHEYHEISVTPSAGLASVQQFRDAEDINRAADEALYDAKGSGRNCVAVSKAAIPSQEASSQ